MSRTKSRYIQFYHCLSPMHNGSGAGLGIIDRPIIRETGTRLPFVQASSIKGSFRDLARQRNWDQKNIRLFFGSDDPKALSRGLIRFSDARLLFFPVASASGVMAWLTSPLLLARLRRFAELTGLSDFPDPGEPSEAKQVFLADERSPLLLGERLIIRDMVFPSVLKNTNLEKLAKLVKKHLFPGERFWSDYLVRHLALVDDDVLARFSETATEVRAQIRIEEDTGVTADGSLRYTEYLPTETILVALLHIEWPTEKKREEMKENFGELFEGVFQLGADETTGKGLTRCRLLQDVARPPESEKGRANGETAPEDGAADQEVPA